MSILAEIGGKAYFVTVQDKRSAKLRFLHAIENTVNKGGVDKGFRKQLESVLEGPRDT